MRLDIFEIFKIVPVAHSDFCNQRGKKLKIGELLFFDLGRSNEIA
jgi:hypothetical protein